MGGGAGNRNWQSCQLVDENVLSTWLLSTAIRSDTVAHKTRKMIGVRSSERGGGEEVEVGGCQKKVGKSQNWLRAPICSKASLGFRPQSDIWLADAFKFF